MWFYYGIGIFAALLTKIATSLFSMKNKHVFYLCAGVFFSAIVVTMFCSVAGLRDITIGTDTEFYAIGDFKASCVLEWDHFNSLSSLKRYPIICRLITFFAGHFTKNFFWYLFIMQLFTCLPVYIATVWYLKDYAWLGVFVFSCYMFPESFNLIRQYMAEGICLLALVSLMKNKPIMCAALITLAVLIHHSAIVTAPMVPTYYYLKYYDKFGVKSLTFKTVIVFIVAAIFLANSEYIYNTWLNDKNEYSGYFSVAGSSSGMMALIMTCFFIFLYLLYLILNRKKHKATRLDVDGQHVVFLIVLSLVGILAFALEIRYAWVGRVGLYYYISWILLFPLTIKTTKGKHEKVFLLFLCLAFILSVSFFALEYKGNGEVVPYKFSNNLVIYDYNV